MLMQESARDSTARDSKVAANHHKGYNQDRGTQMAICENCGNTYDEAEGGCTVCKNVEGANEQDRKKSGLRFDMDGIANGWTTVINVQNEIEYSIVKGLLDTADIPSIGRIKGMDGYLKIFSGSTINGIDILIPMDRFEEANALLNQKEML